MGRPAYEDLPGFVRSHIEASLGSPVVQAESQSGGWSPGVAARLLGADGSRVFVKAVSSALNEQSAAMHRREVVVTGSLPPELGSPRLLSWSELDTWVVIVLEDVRGRTPRVPEDLPAMLAALDRLAQVPAPYGLLPAAQELEGDFGGWRRMAKSGARLEGWARDHLDRLVELEDRWPEAAAGDRLLHLDLRTDNMLLRPDGSIALVDWPWAASGNPLLDVICLLPSTLLQGAADPEALLRSTRAGRRADDEEITCLLAAFVGRMEEHARRPPSPGVETVRAFQAAQAAVALPWLQERLRRAR